MGLIGEVGAAATSNVPVQSVRSWLILGGFQQSVKLQQSLQPSTTLQPYLQDRKTLKRKGLIPFYPQGFISSLRYRASRSVNGFL